MKRIIFIIVIIILLPVASGLTASEEAEAQEDTHHFNWKAFLGRIFDSTILFGLLIILLRKPLIKMLTQKSLDIKNDMNIREEKLKKTKGELDVLNDRLGKIEDEITDMKKAAEQQGSEQMKKLEGFGKKEADRLVALTEEEINNRIEMAVLRVKEHIADLTIEHFKKDIEKTLTPELHKKIIDRNIDMSGEIDEGR
jgi:F0F1-type ATP synthase membrane subunit b/b'